jgi:hypothetical protein
VKKSKREKLLGRLSDLRYELHQAGLIGTALMVDKAVDLLRWEILKKKETKT